MKKGLVTAWSALSILVSTVSIPVMAHDMGGPPTQDLTPPQSIEMYLDGYHLYKKETGLDASKQRQVRTAHYCKQVNPDLFQCALYDSNSKDARLIGIEYVISDKLFQTLPESEKKYWHAHDGEVDSGLLVMPGMPKDKEQQTLAFLRSTHGKTFQVWPNLSDNVPLGEPVLMWNVDPKKVSETTKKSVAARQIDPKF